MWNRSYISKLPYDVLQRRTKLQEKKVFRFFDCYLVKENDTCAILYRLRNRFLKVTNFLFSKGYLDVINLSGGIQSSMKNGVNAIPNL